MAEFTTRPEITGTFGVVASTHWLASQAAMGVLERGGNAFDAVVVGGLLLQVLEPHLNGPGGEVPLLLWRERDARLRAVNGQGVAPAQASVSAFQRLGFEQVPGIGVLAATVPGAFAAWMKVLRDYGTLSLDEALAPVISYAHNGFPLVARAVQAIFAVQDLFRQHWPSSAHTWLPAGNLPTPGALFRLPVLAQTYARVVREAKSCASTRVAEIDAAIAIWQRGFVAHAIDAFCRTEALLDSSGETHAGLLRYDDMAHWQAVEESPLRLEFGRYTLVKCGFWSQGPALLQQAGMLRHANLHQHPPHTADFVHRITEAAKLALADRLAWYGAAPGALPDLQQQLLSAAYLRERWEQVDARAATQLCPGQPGGRIAHLPDLTVAERSAQSADLRLGIGEPTFAPLPPVAEWQTHELFVGDTCHIDVIDKDGNMATATPSGGWLSSSPTIPKLGFALNTRLQMTWLDADLPNTLAPGVAPCTTLSPSMALRDGQPYMVFGTPGGDQQDQWSLAFFMRHAVHGMKLQQAIDAPAWHVEHFPSSFWPRQTVLNRLIVESRFAAAEIDTLRAAGHDVKVAPAWSESRMSACSRERDEHGRMLLRAGANPRGMQGYAVGR